jgi:hypothetical protein
MVGGAVVPAWGAALALGAAWHRLARCRRVGRYYVEDSLWREQVGIRNVFE